ncbi:Vacuolar protein sorting protein [Trypanosoma theileri]|uniref:Vacuolar protein sorting protein n=1 Tax=Trypanosoma theileri TaxID=67003 RepID=A0A1X0NSI1_9TRYP|nr:Vacuolar protein sorting protein [Trypanosoma theileri]ORC87654.1 Vacuolar protein sorting protein [Trypanosoma theileri]
MLTEGDLEELALVELDDDFLETNLRNGSENKALDVELSQRLVQSVCDEFVSTFLGDDGVATLHQLLQECDASLADIEHVLRRYIDNLGRIQQDIGDVRERLKHVRVQLSNRQAVETLVKRVVSRVVVPPDVVRVIVHSSEEQLGTQFSLSTHQLWLLLQYRKEIGVPLGPNGARVSLISCPFYAEQREVLDRLAVHACVKVQRFLIRKLTSLGVPNTNVWIQQEHVLKPHVFYVHFLRSVAPLLSPTPYHYQLQERNGNIEDESPEWLPYRITKALYDEFRLDYCRIMSPLYHDRIRHYVMSLHALEKATQTVPTGSAEIYILPLLTDLQDTITEQYFQLGERGNILNSVFSPPLVPAVEMAKRRTHFYEETFRSLNSLICDAVTHEFLFTFMFFDGDMSVFVDVFKPTIQFIIDYVAEVLLGQGDGTVFRLIREEYHYASVNTNCRYDCYGLLLLIRLCHDFRSCMRDARRLSCLEGFYDSLLLLLWPLFQRTFERQMLALRSADVASLARMALRRGKGRISGTGNSNSNSNNNGDNKYAWVPFVHPLTKRYAAFATALVTISRTSDVIVESSSSRRSSSSMNGTMKTTAKAEVPTEGETEAKDSSDTTTTTTTTTTNTTTTNMVNNGDGDVLDFAELQRVAWRMVEEEIASDAADSASRFAVLVGNLSFMRVEIVRLLQEMGRHLAAHDVKHPEMQHLHGIAFLLNNIYWILSVWRTSSIHTASLTAATTTNTTTTNTTTTAGSSTTERDRDVDVNSDTAMELFGDDYVALQELQRTQRAEFVESLVRTYFRSVHHIVQHDELAEQNPAEVLAVADAFTREWKRKLDDMCVSVCSMLCDVTHEGEILAQVCMEVLLCNTRFHSCVSRAVEASVGIAEDARRPLRSFIVTNQQMLQHMRTLATMVEDGEDEEKEDLNE